HRRSAGRSSLRRAAPAHRPRRRHRPPGPAAGRLGGVAGAHPRPRHRGGRRRRRREASPGAASRRGRPRGPRGRPGPRPRPRRPVTPTAAHLESFLGHLDARDARAATELAVDLALAGATLPDLFGRLIGPAQAEVGRRWLQNAYSVADEHAATAIVDVVVAVLSTQVPPTSIGGPRVA